MLRITYHNLSFFFLFFLSLFFSFSALEIDLSTFFTQSYIPTFFNFLF